MALDESINKDSSGNALTSLSTGLNKTDDSITSYPATDQSVTICHDNVSVEQAAENASAAVNSSGYHKYRAWGVGAEGNLTLTVQGSPDGGTSWLYINEQAASQYPALTGDVITPLIRIRVTNTKGDPQLIKTYLVMDK